MGLWWKNVENFPDESGIEVTIRGDEKAWKKTDVPLLWRWQHRWMIFRVKTTLPYRLFFSDGKRQMEFKQRLQDKQFAARIGRDSVRFVALEDGTEMPLEISQADFRRWSFTEIKKIREESSTLQAYGYPNLGKFKLV